ncbi:hypothetical protein [Halobaculum lipolyticum]|uniref:Domain of unknown function domain-containing protein n=1 Tax=Halobaculum lipolyticum TaxID=3032001 RepID=A0ABD5WD80_9EURY|nr:hypothetical protein [Halobaculum sp. DT31]
MSDERERGILTPADRRYLRGETEFASVQSERNARARIRDRLHAALYDFEVLVEGLSDRDRELVFGDRLDGEGTAAFDALVSAAAFLYRGVDDTEIDFETVLSEGINLAEAGDERAATVDLDVTFHALSVAEVRRKMRAREPLSLTELAFADTRTEIAPDEFAEYLRDDDRAVDDGRIQSRVTDF